MRSVPVLILRHAHCRGLLAEGKSWKEKGPFHLGVFSKPNAVLAMMGGLVLAWVGFQPPNEKVLYLTIGLIVLLFLLWFTMERKRFLGPPTGERIADRQAEIAAVEAHLERA